MDAAIKQEWVTALRSGEYEQGNTVLRSHDNKFCCLGVLCDIYGKHKGVTWSDNPDYHRYLFLERITLLPQEVIEWSGVSEFGLVKGFNERDAELSITLTNLNDNNMSFNQIADVINY